MKVWSSFDIRFEDKSIEVDFQRSKYSYQKIVLIITLFIGVLIAFLGWALNPLNAHNYNSTVMIIMIILIALAAMIPFLVRKRPNFLENILFLLVFIYPIIFLEYTYKHQYLWKGITFFTSGIITELILGIALLSKISWVKRNFVFITFNVLCCFRYTDFENNKEMKFFPSIQYLVNTIALGLAAYFIERQERIVFLEFKNYELSLNSFKNLVENFFPSAVLVIKNGVILFKNDETKKIFPSFENEDNNHIFNHIIIQSSSYENPKMMGLNSLDDLGEDFKNSQYSLKDLLKIIEKSHRKKTKINLCSYGSCNLPEERRKLDLEIKMTNIFWEKKDAIMIIISENRIMKKIKVLNDQSEYKDRLLATVSHDLRTPLNGIIGMLGITIDSITDFSLKKK